MYMLCCRWAVCSPRTRFSRYGPMGSGHAHMRNPTHPILTHTENARRPSKVLAEHAQTNRMQVDGATEEPMEVVENVLSEDDPEVPPGSPPPASDPSPLSTATSFGPCSIVCPSPILTVHRALQFPPSGQNSSANQELESPCEISTGHRAALSPPIVDSASCPATSLNAPMHTPPSTSPSTASRTNPITSNNYAIASTYASDPLRATPSWRNAASTLPARMSTRSVAYDADRYSEPHRPRWTESFVTYSRPRSRKGSGTPLGTEALRADNNRRLGDLGQSGSVKGRRFMVASHPEEMHSRSLNAHSPDSFGISSCT